MATPRYCVFSHGKDSEPWGKKIIAMAETARSEGYAVESIDYRGIDTVEGRIAKLVDGCKNLQGELVLVGSSLGGFIATAASSFLHARGLFLLAPALYMEGLPPLRPRVVDCPVEIVHVLCDLDHQRSAAAHRAIPLAVGEVAAARASRRA